ncbi:carboxylesterase family protein [Microbacterium sp. NPDC007973]|uniref:carboxylesterase family protein n=1 Tax=Microbacterium sp. NPDC007973 TaxID=3364182 RepID=UPI0036F0C0F9
MSAANAELTVRVVRGIRYARARRFERPVLESPGPDRLDARAPQPGVEGSEDCLHLTVWTPEGVTAVPVLVWIHGGAHVSGGVDDPVTDGSHLAATQGLVVVAVQYRLGALGHLLGDGTEVGQDAANAALHDQLAALRWVRDHIATFGGDPSAVTLMGQSAGGVDVLAHLGASTGEGLFHRVIAHSCTAERAMSLAHAARVRDAFLGAAGVGSVREAADLPVAALMAAQTRVIDRLSAAAPIDAIPFRPVIDGRLLPERPLEAIASGAGADIPLLIGSARREAVPWMAKGVAEEHALAAVLREVAPSASIAELSAAYEIDRGRRSAQGELREAVLSELMYRSPVDRVVGARAAAHGAAATFVFDFDPAGLTGVDAGHSGELPMVFGTSTAPAATELMSRMVDAWGSFARGGRPSSEASWCDASEGVFRWGAHPQMIPASDPALRAALAAAGAVCDRL